MLSFSTPRPWLLALDLQYSFMFCFKLSLSFDLKCKEKFDKSEHYLIKSFSWKLNKCSNKGVCVFYFFKWSLNVHRDTDLIVLTGWMSEQMSSWQTKHQKKFIIYFYNNRYFGYVVSTLKVVVVTKNILVLWFPRWYNSCKLDPMSLTLVRMHLSPIKFLCVKRWKGVWQENPHLLFWGDPPWWSLMTNQAETCTC